MTQARTLLLAGLLLGAAQAQTAPEPVPPVEAPAPVSEPAPATPAPVPAPATTPARTAPLLITVQVNFPALVNGKKTTVPFVSTLNLPGERVAVLRQRGVVTESLEADLKTFLASLPAQGQDARFENLGTAGWAVVQRNGLKVDAEQTRANVLAALKDPRAVRANVVVTGQVAPGRTLDFFAGKGITAHLATGVTNYAGSSAARMTNIHVGTRNFQDRLFEGKSFSFNQFIGNISARAGYVPGLIIAGDRTETGLGGGICQVSTTAFRALYGAGLPVVERHTHSYQVHYYQPQGLDAAIYQPTLDLKFANDTGGALWFQADWNDADGHLEISVFGKARDFTVELGQPRVLKTVPSPADRLIRSTALKPGERRQVDWAAPGATMEVTRKLVRGGKVIRQDTLKSTYRPWPNIYLVGR
ncbi:vancomycin resistance protein YoaR [Deinococcus sp. HSC-46F16]|uniref:VanW family protein n=1 Tax=Deinococcus sp. HSC-46F16 TaxID=2910968 RepID=UPI00209C9915|nr:VanW family protein [Deinococcus sp. HSC-46F16]MCP2015264.1 vancomycin resistance protein YoaR [Deinococcus sp. HSC-46F16]